MKFSVAFSVLCNIHTTQGNLQLGLFIAVKKNTLFKVLEAIDLFEADYLCGTRI